MNRKNANGLWRSNVLAKLQALEITDGADHSYGSFLHDDGRGRCLGDRVSSIRGSPSEGTRACGFLPIAIGLEPCLAGAGTMSAATMT